ncbi:MAG TPA: chorismate lyase [Gallionella sp.]|nr:chorismate lyase [Gallionella sp.]
MTTCTSDIFWHSAALGCEADLLPWLGDRGSLTQRIRQRCSHFAVHNVRSGLARIALDESALLGVAPQQLAYSREVFLCADGQPVVFAHSACAAEHLRGTWSALRTLNDQPLGALLFALPQVRRQPLHYKALRPAHPLYQQAAADLTAAPERLWARRSLFCLHDAPLLVTEVFLPEILKLGLRSEDRGSSETWARHFDPQSSILDPQKP